MKNEIAFITGGTSGIGAAFGHHFAQQGYDLILTGHPDDRISPRIEEIKTRFHANVEIVLADLAIEENIKKVENIIKNNPLIGVLINNAGYIYWKPSWENSTEEIESIIKVHINAPVRFINAVLPEMIRVKRGTLITISSISSFMPAPRTSMYCATKLFNNSLMESMYISFRDKGIKVQVLCPGFVHTNFHNRAGVDKSIFPKTWFLQWMDPDEVVKISIRNLKRNRVIVVPGFRNKLLKLMITCVPRRIFYRFATRYLT